MTQQANVSKIVTTPPPAATVPERVITPATRVRETSRPLTPGPRNGLNRILFAGWLNLEVMAWVVIIILAILTRVVDLGPRAMHHDEGTHANFSYGMYKGTSIYKYDPIWHGPYLYYMVSIAYFLFGGASETTARLMPAFYGIGIVALCWCVRPLIGKIGAVAMALFMLLSPTMLYYTRTLRHDVFATFGEFLFVVGVFRFLQNKPGHKMWWIGLSGLGLIIEYASHEMVFLNTAILVAWLGLVFAFELVALPARIKNRRGLSEAQLAADAERQNFSLNKHRPPILTAAAAPAELLADEISTTEVAETAPAGATETVPEVETTVRPTQHWYDPILGNWAIMGGVLFVAIALLVLVGAIHLFQAQPVVPDPTAVIVPGQAVQTDIPKVFGLPQWLLEIPLGLVFALLAGYVLGGIFALGAGRLSRAGSFVTRLTIAVVGGGLALVALAAYFLGTPKTAAVDAPIGVTPTTAATAVTTATAAATPAKTIQLAGLELPSILPQLVFVLIAALFISLLVGWLRERRLLLYTENGLYGAGISFFGIMFIAALVSLRFVLVDTGQPKPKGGLFLAGPEVDKWVAYVFNGFLIALVVAVFMGWLVSLADRLADEDLGGSGAVRGVLRIVRQPRAVALFFVAFGIPYILLFGDFFFNIPGLADGIFRGIEYWASAHELRRIDEPWFYYPWLMMIYEIVATIFSLTALIYFPVRWVRRCLAKGRIVVTMRGLFIGFTLWWTVLAMYGYSVAGEKVPWLNMQIVLPASLAAAAFFNEFLGGLNWRRFLHWRQGPLFSLLFVLMFACLGVLIGMLINLPKAGDPNRTTQIIEAVVVFVIFALLLGYSIWLWWSGQLNGRFARASIVILVTLLLSGYTIRSTIALNYDHPDTANELLVFVQTTPEVPLFLERLQRLSRDLRDTYKITPPPPGTINADPASNYNLPIWVDNEVATPLLWYLRSYTDVGYACINQPGCPDQKIVPSTNDSRNNPYVMILLNSADNTPEVQQQLAANYTMHVYKFRWNFPGESSGYGILDPKTDAKGHTDLGIWTTNWGTVWQRLTQQPYVSGLWRFLIYRELSQPLTSVDMDVYVRNDADPDFSNSDLVAGAGNGATTGGTQVYNLTDGAQPGHKDGQFSQPRNIAVMPDNNFAVLDGGNGRVQIFGPDGKFISKFGSFGSGDGQLGLASNNGGPTGITTDGDGNIYIADTWNYRIQKFDKTGKFLTKWGQGLDTKGQPDIVAANPTGFYGPRSITFDPQKKELYVTDTGNKRIVIFDTDGKFIRQFGSPGSGPGQFNEPISAALRSDGKLFVTDLNNHRIQILDTNGQYQGEIPLDWASQQLSEPYITFDSQNNMYVTDPPNAAIYKYGPDNKLITTYNSNNGALVSNPTGIVFAPDGNLYVVDPKKSAVVKFKP